MGGADTGVGLVDASLVATLWRLRATEEGTSVATAVLLREVDATYGIDTEVAYGTLVAAVQPDLTWIRLYTPTGNFGSRSDPPASPRYTEVRLSLIGEVVAADPDPSVLPIGLINGNAHRRGERPPFDPYRVLDAIEAVVRDPDLGDAEIVSIVGDPSFPARCVVSGDVEALHRGEPVTFRLGARIQIEPDGVVVLSGLPPSESPNEVVSTIIQFAQALSRPDGVRPPRLPVRDIDMRSEDEIAVHVAAGSTTDELVEKLRTTWGVGTYFRALLPAPTATLIRRHTEGDPEATIDALERLRALISANRP